MKHTATIAFTLAFAYLIPGAQLAAQPAAPPVKLLFSSAEDLADTWGRLHFGATAMEKLRECKHPGFTLAYCQPRSDGAWDVYGQTMQRAADDAQGHARFVWKLVRAVTRNGVDFADQETVFTSEQANWTDHLGLAYNSDAKEYLALKLKIDDSGFAYTAFFSRDGRTWKEHPANPLFYEADSLGLFYSPKAQRFVCSSKSLQPFLKHIQDHGGTHPQNHNDQLRDRRVIAIRSSADGRKWEPAVSLMDVWNRLGTYKAVPSELLLTPDADDPPDMEFYRGIGFWYHDRGYLVALNYAASALAPRKHGPQLDTEWWVSRDGLRWERPYRGVNALGAAFPAVPCITHNPLLMDGLLVFHFGNQLFGVKQDRISFVGARANAEFSTRDFVMPRADLYLNAAVPALNRPFASPQAYVMAAVVDEKGAAVPGFEREKCVVQNGDKIDFPLRWNGRSASELAGRRIRLRFALRSADIYAVTTKAAR